ncbi:GNAT family N-acetyltransferase [Photobacterium sp. DA100]|uniref:GNAT family N-acetyltransferase n=1 Tax=Photobacterium sp. DA100 TaxID=3027472 RepID=UPI0024797AE0|nr:GNAT family N-acetyltransferase [Photobacterium sp. DA100]WEM43843.1 GNAT family N-acetyltransferase [Photobacterium sp. DA100]
MLKLERSKVEDADFFFEIERLSGTEEFIIPYSLEKHRELIGSNEPIYLSVFHNDELVGFIILHQESSEAVEFRRIVILSKGRGLGQLAIKAMERFCSKELGCSRVWLDVFESNVRGLHIYRKLGYKPFKTSIYDGQRLLFMEKSL